MGITLTQPGGSRRRATALSNRPAYTTLFSEPWDDHTAGRIERGAGGSALAAETVYSVYGDNADGEVKGAKIVTGAADAAIIIYAKNLVGNPIDLTEFTHAIIDYRIDYVDPEQSADAAQIRFRVGSNATLPDSDRYTYDFGSAADQAWVQQGPHRWVVTKAEFGAPSGAGTWAAIRSMYIRLDKRSGAAALPEGMALSIDRVAFVTVTPPARPRLFVNFDDGMLKNLAASQWLDGVGIRGTFYVNTKYIVLGESPLTAYAAAPETLTLANLLDMQARGHLIGNHTHTHMEFAAGAQFDTADVDEYVADVLRAREWLIAGGLSKGADLLAAPGGNPSLVKAAVDKLLGGPIRQIRLVSTGAMLDGGYRQPASWHDPRMPITHSLSEVEANLIAEADAVIAEYAAGDTHAIRGTLLHATDLAASGARTGLTYWAAKRDAGLVDIVTMEQLLA